MKDNENIYISTEPTRDATFKISGIAKLVVTGTDKESIDDVISILKDAEFDEGLMHNETTEYKRESDEGEEFFSITQGYINQTITGFLFPYTLNRLKYYFNNK